MLGAFAARVAGNAAENEQVEVFPFTLAFALSGLYLILVLGVLLTSPVTDTPPLALLKASEQWLLVIQGLCGTALGWFFVSKQVGGDAGKPEAH
jgi:hypothetical protein